MPQPYRNSIGDGGNPISFDAGAIAMRPNLAAQLATTISNWTNVEISIGRLLSFMMGVKAEVGVAMYESLSGSASKGAVLEAVAKDYFSLDMLDVFHSIVRCTSGPQQRRNNIVHGLWGIHQEKVDCLLWLPPKEALKATAVLHGIIAQQIVARSRGEDAKPATYSGLNTKHVMVYKEEDFSALREDISSVHRYWASLLTYQQSRAIFPENAAQFDQILEKLCSEPPIREALEKIRRGRPNAPFGR